MPTGVILDTSYLITLADPVRAQHSVARQYWKYFTEQAIPIYLPTIVVSEFYIKQEIPEDILRACIVLPFNWDDAVRAAKFDFTRINRQGESRNAIKDDVKIIGQAIIKDASWIITEDASTLYRFALRIKNEGVAKLRPIKLVDGFELSHFNPSGQREIFYESTPDGNDE